MEDTQAVAALQGPSTLGAEFANTGVREAWVLKKALPCTFVNLSIGARRKPDVI